MFVVDHSTITESICALDEGNILVNVHKSSLLAVFDAKQRLQVPLFQRPYVWNEEEQWLPLWEDIERKFIEALEGRKDGPKHFLGALVLDQKQTPTGHVVLRQVIDGQQRLTTLQIFLAAFRDFCHEQECQALADECDKFLFNTGMMADAEVDKFKVWPTQLDRRNFIDVIESRSYDEVSRRHPLQKRPYARKYDPRPKMVEAYVFFFEQLKIFFIGEDGDPPVASEHPIAARADECFQVLRNALMVVVIDLDKDDDPQVIFETLNARGAALLPADLLRNYIFLRALRENLDIEKIHSEYWSGFDDEYWRVEVKQGRLTRPRSDLFMQHYLSSHQGQDVPIKHLYVEYRHWIDNSEPFPNVLFELQSLARQRDNFKRILSPSKEDVLFELCTFLEAYDIRTAYPLLLAMTEAGLSDDEWRSISRVLESYLLRRAVANLNTKNYNRIFLSLTKNMRRTGFSSEALRKLLLELTGESSVWPDDAAFREAWMHKPQYGPLTSGRLRHVFGRLNNTFASSKNERIEFSESPSIEHILPQSWIAHWPLANGEKGLEIMQLIEAPENDPIAVATRKRNDALHTFGNLTILARELNPSLSNLPWNEKKPELMKHSLLPLNQALSGIDVWDEQAISERAKSLFERALVIWPR